MIKQLISDLTYDTISLAQGLSRAKLIGYEINNSNFKNWIINELNGYPDVDHLPDYRIISCDTFATVETYGGSKTTVPINLYELEDKLQLASIYNFNVLTSIVNLEKAVKDAGKEQFGYDEFPQNVVDLIRLATNNIDIITVNRRVQFSQYYHILNLTKQKLIDTLLDLNDSFPDLEDNFQSSQENINKANTIVTNHIYGANSNTNIATGNQNSQSISIESDKKIIELIEELKRVGIPKEEIQIVTEIINNEPDKNNRVKKLFAWLGKMANKAIETGIELQVPLIMAKITELL